MSRRLWSNSRILADKHLRKVTNKYLFLSWAWLLMTKITWENGGKEYLLLGRKSITWENGKKDYLRELWERLLGRIAVEGVSEVLRNGDRLLPLLQLKPLLRQRLPIKLFTTTITSPFPAQVYHITIIIGCSSKQYRPQALQRTACWGGSS